MLKTLGMPLYSQCVFVGGIMAVAAAVILSGALAALGMWTPVDVDPVSVPLLVMAPVSISVYLVSESEKAAVAAFAACLVVYAVLMAVPVPDGTYHGMLQPPGVAPDGAHTEPDTRSMECGYVEAPGMPDGAVLCVP